MCDLNFQPQKLNYLLKLFPSLLIQIGKCTNIFYVAIFSSGSDLWGQLLGAVAILNGILHNAQLYHCCALCKVSKLLCYSDKIMGKRDFERFEFQMRFGTIFDTTTASIILARSTSFIIKKNVFSSNHINGKAHEWCTGIYLYTAIFISIPWKILPLWITLSNNLLTSNTLFNT